MLDEARLRVFAPAVIGGSILGSGHRSVNAGGSLAGDYAVVVEGNIELTGQVADPDGTSSLSSVRRGTQVHGSVEVSDGFGRFALFEAEVWGAVEVSRSVVLLAITDNILHASVEVSDNSFDLGVEGIRGLIGGNVIGGNLECDGNDPGPTDIPANGVPQPNTVSGSAEGQCAGLEAQ